MRSWHRRSDLELLQDQLIGLRVWQRALAWQERPEAVDEVAHRGLLDRKRQEDALARTQLALLARVDDPSWAAEPSARPASARAVVVHRQSCLRERISACLADAGVDVITATDGTDALAALILEQPDLVLLEDRLPGLGCRKMLYRARELAPRTVLAVHVAHDIQIAACLEAGAQAVFTGRVPPSVIATELVACLHGRRPVGHGLRPMR